ncbi:uncharacterized protein [Typha latifolia]|uniref:uncharacterized protein isoform X3 n=1 Tax=Typha latifolia TaxID=4733 RepID=UPI003C2C256E
MVCMLGQRRMAAMVRLLMVENVPDITPAEEVTHEKIAAQIIHKEFLDADEANLLEEEDMHIFECRPLTDPLHLVRCNSCKKPIKASQYAAHSERCRLLAPIRDTALDLEVDSGHKKPPRKGRKMSQATNGNHRIHIGEKEKSESVDRNDVGRSESKFENQSNLLSPQSGEAQRTMDSLHHVTVTNSSEMAEKGRGTPVPLATKIYHSQGNYRLRLELGHLYHEACAKEHTSTYPTTSLLQENRMMASQVSPGSKLPYGANKDDVPQVKDLDTLDTRK